MSQTFNDLRFMQQAIDLAQKGIGFVEPNPAVGCVIVNQQGIQIGQGWHESFGQNHAEINAINSIADDRKNDLAGSTVYVTLEPCSHQGKTPPCCNALIKAKVARVVIGIADPNPQVNFGGIKRLEQAGIQVECGILEPQVCQLNAPYLKFVKSSRPWVIAKWAMTLDGKIASRAGDSQWISSERSRAVVHEIRGRMDGILVGSGTAQADDPRLTARPAGPRTPLRVILDSNCKLSPQSKLVKTAAEVPTLIVTEDMDSNEARFLQDAGFELWGWNASWSSAEKLNALLDELGRRQVVNLLVEGGSQVLGAFFDAGLVDEVHTFIAPRIVGGEAAVTPVAGVGLEKIDLAFQLEGEKIEQLDRDLYITGRVKTETNLNNHD